MPRTDKAFAVTYASFKKIVGTNWSKVYWSENEGDLSVNAYVCGKIGPVYCGIVEEVDKTDFAANRVAGNQIPVPTGTAPDDGIMLATRNRIVLCPHSRVLGKSVAANTTDWDDVVIPNGETWVVYSAAGASPGHGAAASNVALIWDRMGTPEVLFVTYDTWEQPINRTFVGDGTKRLSMRLKNAGSVAVDLFCLYHAEKV